MRVGPFGASPLRSDMAALFTPVIALLSLLVLSVTAWQFQSKKWLVAASLLWLTAFYEAILVVFPVWYSAFTGFELDSAVNAGPTEMLLAMLGELLFVLLFCLTLRLAARRVKIAGAQDPGLQQSKITLHVLVAAQLVLHVYLLITPSLGFTAMTHHGDVYTPSSILDMLMQWTRGAIQVPGIIAAAVVVTGSRYKRVPRMAAAVALALLALVGLSEGVRGRITWIVCVMLLMGIVRKSWKPAVAAAIVLAIVAPYSAFLGGQYRAILYSGTEEKTRLQELKRLWYSVSGQDPETGSEGGFLLNLAERAQGPRNCVVLMRLHDAGQGASYKPLLSALYTPIPRLFWPGKRPAGSTDDTNYGSAIFLVRRLGYGAPIYNMGSILASGHAYWEGGWIWLCGCAILTGLAWCCILSWCQRKLPNDLGTTLAITFCAALPIDGLFTMLNPLYALIAILWSAILPVLLMTWLLGIVIRMRRRVRKTRRTAIPEHRRVAALARPHASSNCY